MLLDYEMKVGSVCAWCIDGLISDLHPMTQTVVIRKIEPRYESSPLVTVESIQTGEVFSCDTGHLTAIERMPRIVQSWKDALSESTESNYRCELWQKQIDRFNGVINKTVDGKQNIFQKLLLNVKNTFKRGEPHVS